MGASTRGAAWLALALLLAGCSYNPLGRLSASDPAPTGSLGKGSIKETSAAAKAWEADPGNRSKGLAYARQLMAIGRGEEAVKVVEDTARRNPEDLELAAYLGKILVQSGRLTDGEQELRRAIAGGKADWRVHSALGSALDQVGRHAEARESYQAALKLKPDEITVINNIGLSYALQGDLKTAEAELKRASALPGGRENQQVRQNLALVMGLQGRFDEARDIASRDLPRAQVEANLAYLKEMTSQPNPWEQLKEQPAAGGADVASRQ